MPGGDTDLVRGPAELTQDLLRQGAPCAPAVDEEQDPLLAGANELNVPIAQEGCFPRSRGAHDEGSPSSRTIPEHSSSLSNIDESDTNRLL